MLTHPPTTDSREAVAARRLRGTIWLGFSPARVVYSALLGLAELIAARGVSANTLTITSLVLGVPGTIAAAAGRFWLAIGAFLASAALDALDGAVARATRTETRFGALLDSTSDRAADALPWMGVVAYLSLEGHGAWTLAPLSALVTSFGISYVRARAEGLDITLPPLFMRRAERVVLTLLLLAAAGSASPTASWSVLVFGAGLLAVLQAVAAGAALRAAHRLAAASRGER